MHAPHPVIDQLRAILGDDDVLSARDELLVYECDGFPIAKGQPMAVVFPTTTQQVSECVQAIAQHDLQIVPRGSGTGLAGAAVAYDPGVLVTTTRMNQIESIDYDNRVAVVQPGVRNLALSQAMTHSGWRFSPDPSSQRASTIGGNASTNAGGINTLKYGVTTNHILGLELVTADGTVTTTHAGGLCDGIGADLPGLICGSEGTFGIITKIWCRLTVDPKHMRTVYSMFPSVGDACKTVVDVVAAGIVPTSMEMMDQAMIQIVEKAFGFGFPDDAKAMLLLEIDGIEQVLDEQLEQIIRLFKENHADDVKQCSDPTQRDQLWAARKKAFGAIGRVSHSYCTQDACIPRSMLPQAMDYIARLGRDSGFTITNVFHAGDGNIHPILLFDEEDPQQVQQVMHLSEKILEYCVDIGGTITGEHGVGVEKLHLMGKMFNRATLDSFLEIKKTFDPDQRINDAKLIPSDKTVVQIVKPTAANTPGGAL